LKSTSGWNNYIDQSGNGTDDFGFSALPGGNRHSGGPFRDAGDGGYWWTATVGWGGLACYRYMYYSRGNVDEYYDDKGFGLSVRCVEN